jgi:hypothetical protein
MDRNTARIDPIRRDGVEGGGTQRQRVNTTGETLAEATLTGREAYKGDPRKRSNKAEQGVGGGHSTNEARENRGEGRAATSITRPTLGKAAGMPPQGKAQYRTRQARRQAPARLDYARKLQRTLYRAAKQQPERRFTHKIDWAVMSELQLWLRRKHQRSWRSARKRWNYRFLYQRCRLYQMVGRVSHLPGLRRTPPNEDGRRAGWGKSPRPVR